MIKTGPNIPFTGTIDDYAKALKAFARKHDKQSPKLPFNAPKQIRAKLPYAERIAQHLREHGPMKKRALLRDMNWSEVRVSNALSRGLDSGIICARGKVKMYVYYAPKEETT